MDERVSPGRTVWVLDAAEAVCEWVPWPGTVDVNVAAARAGFGDANYLWPISRNFNPNFKGVIFVDGNVGISGTIAR